MTESKVPFMLDTAGNSENYVSERYKNRIEKYLTTRNLLFSIILIQIGTIGYLLFKPQEDDCDKGSKSMKADVNQNENIQDIKRINERNFEMIISILNGLKSDVQQVKTKVNNSNAFAGGTTENMPSGRKLILAALNEPHAGDMGGLSWSVDSWCNKQARAAGFITATTGKFESFLGADNHQIYNNVPPELRNLPIVNTKGEKLFNSWESLFDGQGGIFPTGARFFSFNGKNVLNDDITWPDKMVWHGALVNGSAPSGFSCNSWSTNSSRFQGLASSLYGPVLLSQQKYPCTTKYAVLCIQDSLV